MPTPPKFSSPQQDPLSPDGMPEQIYSSSSEGKSVAQKLYEEALLDPSVNHPGVRLVSYCNGGLVSCHYWSPVMLDHLQVEVREDAAYGELNNVVIEDATELYNQYPSWNKDRSNNVIAAMNDTLKEVTRRMKDAPKEAGDRAPIIKFREPVQPEIVTPQGAPGGEIKWEQCADGRWRISFFVRTLASMKKEKETGRFASTLSNVEVDEREEERMQFQQAIAQEQQARQAVQQQHREEMLHLQEEANRRHQEAMAEQRKEMQIQMAAMQQQFQQMMMAAAAGATQGPPPVPTSQSEEWMDPVDISNGPVPDGAGSS